MTIINGKNQDEIIVAGIMSGTSVDGLDIALCKFTQEDQWGFEILEAVTYAYPKNLHHSLATAMALPSTDLNKLSLELGRFIGDKVNDLTRNSQISPVLVASHGHTVFHQPEKGITVQIGDGKTIANTCNLPVINDFRSLDVSLGGQGAPLVPIGDQLLFASFDYCLNLGGIANVSFKKGEHRIAYDVCFANMTLNEIAQRAGKPYDEDGKMARKGSIINSLLTQLNSLPYFGKNPPKSLGKEDYDNWIMPLLLQEHSCEDLLSTMVEHTAIQIGSSIPGNGKLIVTGGGAHNTYLIDRIRYHASCFVELPSDNIIDFKEALIFAFLGLLRWRNEVNCLASVTGAKRDSSGGTVHLPN